MRTFLTVLNNDYHRTSSHFPYVVVMTVFTLASIFLAIYMTGVQQVKGHVVLVTTHASADLPNSSKYLDITVLPTKPPYSDLVTQKYDAYVTIDSQGAYQIETLHSDSFTQMILALLKNPEAPLPVSTTDRGIGVNIIGFMMMFLLMVSFVNLYVFAEDKEQGQLFRIATTPTPFGWYLAAHCVYCLSFLLPEYLLLVVLKCCGWSIGFTLLQYAGLMASLGFLGISLAMLLNTLIQKPDNANMLGNSITVLTSVLSGGFYSFTKNNALLDDLIKILPQKELMDFAQYLQNGEAWRHYGPILYVIGFSLVLYGLSCTILWKKYVKKI